MDPVWGFPSQSCAGCRGPAVLCSSSSDVRDGVECEMLSHSAVAEQGSVYSNSEEQIGNRISPNRRLVFQKGTVVMGCTAEQTPQFIQNDFTLDKTQQVGLQAHFTWAPSCSWLPFPQDLLEIVFLLPFCAGWGLATARPRNLDPVCLFVTNSVSITCSPPSGAQELWCFAPAAASWRCPFRNSALLLNSPSFTESIAADFKSSFLSGNSPDSSLPTAVVLLTPSLLKASQADLYH